MKIALSPLVFLLALPCCGSPRVVSGPDCLQKSVKEGTKRGKKALNIIIILQSGIIFLAILKPSRKKQRASGPRKCFTFLQQTLSDNSKADGTDGDVSGDVLGWRAGQCSGTQHRCPEGNPVPRCVQQENRYNPIYLPPPELAVVVDSCQQLSW